MSQVVLLCHGTSLFQAENRLAGWSDVGLASSGIMQAHCAGELLYKTGYQFDHAFTSNLKRAIHTLWTIQENLQAGSLPVEMAWQLNERHYGCLQGYQYEEVRRYYGRDLMHRWLYTYGGRPPAVPPSDLQHACFNSRCASQDLHQVLSTESFEDTEKRVVAYWREAIAPKIAAGKRLLIVAHEGSLRVLIRYLWQLSGIETVSLPIPAGIPVVLEFNVQQQPLKYYSFSIRDLEGDKIRLLLPKMRQAMI